MTDRYRSQPVTRVGSQYLGALIRDILIAMNAELLRLRESDAGSGGSGGVAVGNAAYITTLASAALTAERILTGTANQIAITDGGPNSTVVVSTPQDLDIGTDFQVGTLKATVGAAYGRLFQSDADGDAEWNDVVIGYPSFGTEVTGQAYSP